MQSLESTATPVGLRTLSPDELEKIEPAAKARQESLRKDHVLDIKRARFLGSMGAVIWPFFILYDLVQTTMVGSSSFVALLSLRIAGEVGILVALAVLMRNPPISEVAFRRMVPITVSFVSALLAGMCVATDGLASIYVAGNLLAGVALIFAPQPFRIALRTIVLSLSVHPIILGIAAFYSPTIRAQSSDPVVLGRLIQYGICAVVLGASFAWFSDIFYGMRKTLYASRGIGRYRIRRLLGAGGTSEVWAAYHEGLEREVALKLLEPRLEHREDAQKRFVREIRATARLTHPNTIRVYDYGVTEEGVLFYAMELLRGMNLAELVASEGRAPAARAVFLVRQAARSLMEAHARGIVHRDVKPENIFLCEAGLEPDFVKVLDFGIATIRVDETRADEDEEALGTPTTMSPEVIQGMGATPASDVYGMGVVLYHLLTGSYPFAERRSAAILAAHLSATPVPPSIRLGERIPEALEALVMRCLAKDPALRPRNGRELAAALEEIARALPFVPGDEFATPLPFVAPPRAEAPLDHPTMRPSRRPPALG